VSRHDERWQAVRRRDAGADGEFVYSVRTTGIYSRPSCAGRSARRENVVFFDTGAQAEAAGYRACRRCDPDRPARPARNLDLVVRACRGIDGDHAVGSSLDELADGVGLSRYHFHRLFKKVTGITPHSYRVSSRGRRVRVELLRSASITDAIYNAGFNSNGRFYAAAPDILGMTPTRFRDGGKGEVVQYSLWPGRAGCTLVALGSKGVCDVAVAPGAEPAVLGLRATFPHARLVPAGPWLAERARQLLAAVEARGPNPSLPADVRGTVLDFLVRDAFRDVVPAAGPERPRAVRGAVGRLTG
jgi:AraC family transcriptional regulator of adaptative response/methylated-DNA-[protein]-cysteine methyltransferase